MPMGKRKLKAASQTRRVKKTAAERTKQAKNARLHKTDKKTYNKAYYRKNKAEILKRAKLRRARRAKGDVRTTRRASAM